MKIIEGMTGAADAQDEVVEVPYEKSGAFIGGLAGVVAGGVAGFVLVRMRRRSWRNGYSGVNINE